MATDSTQFAYQAILGVGYNIDTMFRVNLDARYYGTTNPYLAGTGYSNNNVSAMLSLQVKFGAPAAAAAAAACTDGRGAVVHGVLRLGPLEPVTAGAEHDPAGRRPVQGQRVSARITATGHADRSGPEDYNMALSLRRANAVKDALVRDGVPATAISVIGKGETQPLVQTADGVREPQNRRVEIVLQ